MSKKNIKQGEILRDVNAEDGLEDAILVLETNATAAFKQMMERIGSISSTCNMLFYPRMNENIKSRHKDKISDSRDTSHKSKSKSAYLSDSEEYDSTDEIACDDIKDYDMEQKDIIKSGGLFISLLNTDCKILVCVSLLASKFDKFRCDKSIIQAGINIQAFCSFMKNVNDNCPITLYIKEGSDNLYVRCAILEEKIIQYVDIKIHLAEIKNSELSSIDVDYKNAISINSDHLHQTFKNVNTVSSNVQITFVNGELIFEGANDNGKVKLAYKDKNNSVSRKSKGQIIQTTYPLAPLIKFSNCSKMCTIIMLSIRHLFPLCMIIKVANLGIMKLLVAPAQENTH